MYKYSPARTNFEHWALRYHVHRQPGWPVQAVEVPTPGIDGLQQVHSFPSLYRCRLFFASNKANHWSCRQILTLWFQK